jgi:nitroreductase
MTALADALRTAPTTRRFLPDPVDPAAIARALELARFAPSAGNRQPWRVVVVTDAADRRAIRDAYLPHWRDYLQETGTAAAVDTVPLLREADAFAAALHEVPVHLVVCAALDVLHAVDGRGITAGASIYPFIQNLLLALRGEELGAALVTLAARAEPRLRELLALPDDVAVAGIVATGRRAHARWPALRRMPVEEFAYAGTWGRAL